MEEAAVLERLRRIEALEQAHATRAAVLDELRALVREAEACAAPSSPVQGEEAAM